MIGSVIGRSNGRSRSHSSVAKGGDIAEGIVAWSPHVAFASIVRIKERGAASGDGGIQIGGDIGDLRNDGREVAAKFDEVYTSGQANVGSFRHIAHASQELLEESEVEIFNSQELIEAKNLVS